MKVYPIFLNNLTGRRCVVIGGNHEAERKALELVECDAAVEVISPEVTDDLRASAQAGELVWHPRDYQPGDLDGAFLVIISETNPPRTRPIWEEAQARGVLINAMDDVPHCTFVAGSVVKRGPLTIAISTAGFAPTIAVRLRQRLEHEIGPEYGTTLLLMKALRPAMAATYPDFMERRRRWYALVDGGILEQVATGDLATVHAHVRAHLGDAVADAVFHADLHVPGLTSAV